VKRSVETGGKFPARNSADRASSPRSVPSHSQSATLVMASTLFMSMPSGFVETICDEDVPWIPTVRSVVCP
jgi:hypothetical protein